MTDRIENEGNVPDDMSEYLQTFLDETEEQLDDLVETMLSLEQDSTDRDDLNEAFRLIHSIKGSAGMMGLDSITVLTHHLENRFERFRSGTERLDEPTMNLVLRCIDFLRQCSDRLRKGEQLGGATELLEELKQLEDKAHSSGSDAPKQTPDEEPAIEVKITEPPSPASSEQLDDECIRRMVVHFRAGLQLADLKAQLIVTRLSGLGEIHSTQPDLEQLPDIEQLETFEVRIATDADDDRLRAAADVDGVEAIDFPGAHAKTAAKPSAADAESSDEHGNTAGASPAGEPAGLEAEALRTALATHDAAVGEDTTATLDEPGGGAITSAATPQQAETSEASATETSTTKVAETMRVDIDRLDNLMNLAGELVVNRARFVQINGQISPALRQATMQNRIRDYSDGLRRTIESLENAGGDDDRSNQIQQLRAGLELMEEQSKIWGNGRLCFGQISEAIDQLSRVSHSLQRGVLDTRMVPVGPLFNRFKRVVRDLSKERGKRVDLLIRGEKTELDKRMIDELGDPLVHLVRNSVDHGLESPDVRADRGKPEAGSIYLEASHSGNNVYIHVRDDGQGIDVEKIKAKLIQNKVLSESAAAELSDQQALEYIWDPGFSTAQEVTDVSGRGVGMDAVKTRISRLNGTIEVSSIPQQGTTFTLRLPLTLAIIDCLLARLRDTVFLMPIDDVREIVSVDERAIITVQGNQTFDVRGQFLPLVGIDDLFHWHGVDHGHGATQQWSECESPDGAVEVVILQAAGKTLGLRVDELLGSEDIVIKSLSDNFVDIRGLSGASILGDGSVALMLDVATLIDMATKPLPTPPTTEAT